MRDACPSVARIIAACAIVLAIAVAPSRAQEEAPPAPSNRIPAASRTTSDSLAALLHADLRAWIAAERLVVLDTTRAVTSVRSSLRQAIEKRLAGQTVGESEIRALELVTLVESAKHAAGLMDSLIGTFHRMADLLEALSFAREALDEASKGLTGREAADPCSTPGCVAAREKLLAVDRAQAPAGVSPRRAGLELASVGDLRAELASVTQWKDEAFIETKMRRRSARRIAEREARLQEMIAALMTERSTLPAAALDGLR